jgi:hypothetical protein
MGMKSYGLEVLALIELTATLIAQRITSGTKKRREKVIPCIRKLTKRRVYEKSSNYPSSTINSEFFWSNYQSTRDLKMTSTTWNMTISTTLMKPGSKLKCLKELEMRQLDFMYREGTIQYLGFWMSWNTILELSIVVYIAEYCNINIAFS